MPQSFLYANPGTLSIIIDHRPITFTPATARALTAILPECIRAARSGAQVRHTVNNLSVVTDIGIVAIAQPLAERVAMLSVDSAEALQNALPRYIRTAEQLEHGYFLQLTPIH